MAAEAHPELVPRYERLYARRAYVPAEYRQWLAGRVAPLLVRHGLDRQSGGAARGRVPRRSAACRGTRKWASRRAACPQLVLPGVLPGSTSAAGEQGPATPVDGPEQLSLL